MSRLLNNSDEFRLALESRNLYSIDENEYSVRNENENESLGNSIINAVNSISSVLSPYSGYDMSNSVFGRLIEDKTPLTEIGLVMLGKQFAFSTSKRTLNETLPTIKPSNIFNGNPIFTPNINYRITKDDDANFFQKFLDITTFYTPDNDNIFNQNSTNFDYFENTGDFQINVFYDHLNRNVYNNILYLNDQLDNRSINIIPNKIFFTTDYDFTSYEYKYLNREIWANDGNDGMRNSYNIDADIYPEYAINLEFVRNYFGYSDVTPPRSLTDLSELNDWINQDSGFSYDDDRNKIVWGRDGTTANLRQNREGLTGFSEEEVQRNLSYSNDLEEKFKNRKGLLAYTKNLINAKGGQIGDITRKAFKKGNEITAFNGSGLWKAPDNSLEKFRGRKGVRQHTVLDQYDRFAKAIRFEGNEVYGGNENSVINKTVIPKIHPIFDQENRIIDNSNLMFSIENLAIETNGDVDPKTNSIQLNDEYGTKIPKCEVGQFGGRVMWFPPYNLDFNESTSANFESTVMVGRNEPVYNYMHGERSGTIRFSLLMDYPPHLKNYQGINKHKEIAEFFAFGGEKVDYELPDIDDLEKDINNIDTIPINKTYNPTYSNSVVKIYFPNDVPNDDEVDNIINELYLDYEYEIRKNYRNKKNQFGSNDGSGSSFGLNKNNFYEVGLVKIVNDFNYSNEQIENADYFELETKRWTLDENKANNINQYNYESNDSFTAYVQRDDFEQKIIEKNIDKRITNLDKLLLDSFNDDRNFQVLKIVITGYATKRFADQSREALYNQELANRRIKAVRNLINSRLRVLFDKTIDSSGIEIEEINIGSSESETSESDTMKAKNERRVEVEIELNGNDLQEPIELTNDQITQINENQERKQELQDQIDSIKKKHECFFNERGTGDDKGILKGFQSASGRYFYPVFHSQTPEDFHRRLTFLQQCMRQGKALNVKPEVDENGIVRSKNSVFGRQPICVLRIGDFFHTKIIIENLTIDYDDSPWDMNPEGFGMQPMIANVSLQIKIIGGQSLRGPINALQNALSFNYYANSTYVNQGTYRTPSFVESKQYGVNDGDNESNNNNDNDDN